MEKSCKEYTSHRMEFLLNRAQLKGDFLVLSNLLGGHKIFPIRENSILVEGQLDVLHQSLVSLYNFKNYLGSFL